MWREEIHRGVVLENPVVISALGFCPLLAVSASMKMALAMAFCFTLILAFSNGLASVCRAFMPERMRMLFLFCCSALATSVVQVALTAIVPTMAQRLGIYLPLCAVSCLVYLRMSRFAIRNGPGASVRDGLVMGLGFTVVLFFVTFIRETIGSNSLFGYGLVPGLQPVRFFEYAPGGFIVLGIVLALYARSRNRKNRQS